MAEGTEPSEDEVMNDERGPEPPEPNLMNDDHFREPPPYPPVLERSPERPKHRSRNPLDRMTAGLPRLFGHRFVRGTSHHNCAGLQIDGGAQHAFPQIVCRGDGQPHRLSLFFCGGKHFAEQQLLDRAEHLV